MNTDHFEYMIEIAKSGNLSKAAKNLGISQSVLSRYLSRLERQHGCNFFYYENRKLCITTAGKIYLSGVTRMRDIEQQMICSIEKKKGLPETTLAIGMSPFHGGNELAAFYPKLIESFPNLNLLLKEGNTKELFLQLQDNKLTCLLNLYDHELLPGTKLASLNHYEVLLGIPVFHPLAKNGGTFQNPMPLHPDDLKALNDLTFAILNTETVLGFACKRFCQQYDFSPRVIVNTSNPITISSLIASGTYGGFFFRDHTPPSENLCFFRFEKPFYLDSGLICLIDHNPTEVELKLYELEVLREQELHPTTFYLNSYGEILMRRLHDGYKNI